MKSYGVTIQIKLIGQNFHMVLFTLQDLTKQNKNLILFVILFFGHCQQ